MQLVQRAIQFLSFCALAVSLCACQSPAYKSFEKVRVGMDKASIVESVGNPTKAIRWHGKDRWIYEFGDHPGGVLVREVHFDQGLATYVGPRVSPVVSAAEQDRINEEKAKADADGVSAESDEHDQLLGAHRPSRTTRREPEDAQDRKLRESLYGLEPDQNRERAKRAPMFVPIQ